MNAPDPNLLEMKGITKRFPGVVALKDVSLTLRKNEVLALMGENGAGKSTLMKILGGAQLPDEGEILIDGRAVVLNDVREAKQHGIALIHQELMLAPNLDIASNIFLGSEDPTGILLKPLRRKEMVQKANELLKRVGLSMPATTPVARLTAGQMQLVEIAKALSSNARIIIMDEPTSSLAQAESEQLFAIVEQLRREGIGIIYISHRIEEVLRLADRITVLRDGSYVGDLARPEKLDTPEDKKAMHDKIVEMMVGRELGSHYFPQKRTEVTGDVVLEVTDLIVPGSPAPASFSAIRGEILGFAGLVGAGRTELMQTIYGVTPALGGTMRLEGKPFVTSHPVDAIRRGVYLAPEDRKLHGLVLGMSVAENTSLPDIANYARAGWLNRQREQTVAQKQVDRLRTKTPSIRQKVVNLSGGNQQKVVLGKWLAMSPKVLILDEPTRGIDVGAKAEIYRQMMDLAKEGITILMVSSDLEEIIGMSDRVVVMHERRIKGVLPREDLTQMQIAALMTGGAAKQGTAA